MIDEHLWRELESRQPISGRSMRRLFPESGHDIHVSVSHPSLRRMLLLRTDARSAESVRRGIQSLPRTAGLELSLSAVSVHQYELQVVLTEEDLGEVFTPLAADIAGAMKEAPTPQSAAEAVLSRFGRWQQLLRSVLRDGLSREARWGLFGELYFLHEHVLTVVDHDVAIRAWTGPGHTNQDFQLPGAAVEVKTTTRRGPNSVRITSERQLDTNGAIPLVLVQLVLDDRLHGLGKTLNMLVDDIRGVLDSSSARYRFEHLLVQAGYLPSQRDLYEDASHTVRRIDFWEACEGFPRVVEGDLPTGVGNCSYTIDTAVLEPYRVAAEAVGDLIRGTHG
ncbi:PD-(D/E)XK motif protein [Streptomyces roseolus]|uniref:PD-(D/E)XK motif protein n=1 Tax=Streptomyces roseolus TaxID=67358 RepID=UPI0037911FEF